MDFIWILFAFLCGFCVKLVALPPLIGFLFAGFLLNFIGVEPDQNLNTLADLGITLMLFTIGLKLNVKDLLKREVWAATGSNMLIWTVLFASLAMLLVTISVPYFLDLDLQSAAILGFALSFSSTVCIVKMLEENGEMKTRHGRLSIAVLVMQDIIAVVFLVLATGKTPTIWALLLFGLPFARPLINLVLNKAGHGELLPLTGFFFALGAYELFTIVGVKGDLGALIFGMLISQHPKASELSKSLLAFKDIFLIGFFLSIGFTALPDLPMLVMALGLSLLLVLKFFLFFFTFVGLRVRGRSAYLSALALSNFSEFGLIVLAISTDAGWISKEWLVILALAVSISFIITSVLYHSAHSIYSTYQDKIKRFQRKKLLKEDILIQPEKTEVMVIGMGRVGQGAFNVLYSLIGDRVWGMDADQERIKKLLDQGKHVFYGDGEDHDLWESLDVSAIKLILITISSIDDISNIAMQLRNANYQGQIAAIVRYEDEREQLIELGIDKVFNFYTEVGTGFADEFISELSDIQPNSEDGKLKPI